MTTKTALTLLRPQWHRDAACRGESPTFFPPNGERPEQRVIREAEAKKICATCPCITPCREQGRTNREQGIWGGESDADRILLGCGPTESGGHLGRLQKAVRAKKGDPRP